MLTTTKGSIQYTPFDHEIPTQSPATLVTKGSKQHQKIENFFSNIQNILFIGLKSKTTNTSKNQVFAHKSSIKTHKNKPDPICNELDEVYEQLERDKIDPKLSALEKMNLTERYLFLRNFCNKLKHYNYD